MRKKIYVLAAAAVITGIILTACASKGGDTKPETTTEAVTEAPTVETESGETAESSPASDGDNSGEAPEGLPADEMLDKAHEAVKAVYGDNYIPSMPYDEVALKEVFGVSSELYDSFIAEGPMISVNVETFVGVKAKEGKAEDVAAALEGYKKKQLDEAVQYPMNMVKLQAAQVVTHGDYVFFLMLGAADQAEEEKGEKEALESAKKNNQLAVDAIAEIF